MLNIVIFIRKLSKNARKEAIQLQMGRPNHLPRRVHPTRKRVHRAITQSKRLLPHILDFSRPQELQSLQRKHLKTTFPQFQVPLSEQVRV